MEINLDGLIVPDKGRKKTRNCIPTADESPIIAVRDADMDTLLSEFVPHVTSGLVCCIELRSQMSCRELAATYLDSRESDNRLKRLLCDRGLAFHPEQVLDLAERTGGTEETGLTLGNNGQNFFFVADEVGQVTVFALYSTTYLLCQDAEANKSDTPPKGYPVRYGETWGKGSCWHFEVNPFERTTRYVVGRFFFRKPL